MTAILQSPTLGALLPALLAVQSGLPAIVKANLNEHFKNRYADLSTVLDAVLPSVNGAGLVVVQQLEVGSEGEIVLHTRLLHSESGEWLGSDYPIRPVRDDPQSYGSAISYARRYGLLALICAAPTGDDDDGNRAAGSSPPMAKSGKPNKPASKNTPTANTTKAIAPTNAPAFSTNPDQDAESLADAIDAAPNLNALFGLAEHIKSLPADYLPPLRTRFEARRQELRPTLQEPAG